MARQLDLTPLRENGPIDQLPFWPSPLPVLPPDDPVTRDSPWRGEDKIAGTGAPSPSPLPKGEGVEAAPIEDGAETAAPHKEFTRRSGQSDCLNPESGPLNPEPQTPNPSQSPSRGGRPKALDEDKRATVCNLIAAGVSLRQAAQFVDCDRRSVRREAQRNGEFRRQLAKARSEASIHPMVTLRQAAKADWRAALCWMERLDPERFARPDASVVTQREANRFVADLVESIERAVSDSSERDNLFELLSAAMPAAMRRRWDGHRVRRHIQQTMRIYDETKIAERQRQDAERRERDKRRDELFHEIARYLPDHLYGKLGRNFDLLDPEEVFADGPQESASKAPAATQNDAATNASSTSDDRASADSTNREPTSEPGATGSASAF